MTAAENVHDRAHGRVAGAAANSRTWLVAAALLLLLSLARPALELPRSTQDVVFVVDITGSMYVSDAGPPGAAEPRLAFAKKLVHAAVDEMRCGSRVGLGIFTEHRTFLLFTPVELCENHLVLATMIDAIDGRMAWAELSEVAKGLVSGIEAVAALNEMADPAEPSAESHLVFLTDGHEAPPVHPQLRPKFRGQPGETGGLIAGIGGSEPQPIPILDEQGEVVRFWRQDEVLQVDRHSLGRPSTQGSETMAGVDSSDVADRIARGTEHLSSLREAYLQQLAAEAGLDYLRATTAGEFARAVVSPRYANRQIITTNIAWLPAALSLLCVAAVFGSRFVNARAVSGDSPRRTRRDVASRRFAPHR